MTGEAFSYGPGGLASWHCQTPFPASASLLSNLERETALPFTAHDRGDHVLTGVDLLSLSPSEQQHVTVQQVLLKSRD